MKTVKFVVAMLITAIVLAACSPASSIAKYSMGPTEASVSCATPEPGKTGACKVPGVAEPTGVPSEISPTSTLSAPTATPFLEATKTLVPKVTPTKSPVPQENLSKSDGQGAVTVEIKPENLTTPGDTLIFDISMNTHSVDLSMDLAKLAVLSTDSGKTVQALKWDAPRGGHHVSGKLSFPKTLNGKNLLEGAQVVTVIIKNVDAPSRTFSWRING